MTEVAADSKVSILLVDDRPGNLMSLKGILEGDHYHLITAESGEEALRIVLRRDLALILLDVAMPGMDGFEVASLIKQRERFKAIPIIFVTASIHHIEWIFKAYSVGAVDFLQKPLDPHAVRAKVAVFVELYRQKQEITRQARRLQDVERRERELEVARLKVESEHRYRHLADVIPDVVFTAGPDGEIELFNRRWHEVTGRPEDLSVGHGWRSAIHPEDEERVETLWARGIGSSEPFQVAFRLAQKDGQYRWSLGRAVPETNEAGSVLRWVGTLMDIEEEKRAHAALEKTVRLRDEFLSVASHELKTPLSTLQLQLESLQRLLAPIVVDPGQARLKKKLAVVIGQSERLASLVDGLLDVSRIAQGRLELDLVEFDLVDAVREVADRFQDDAARAGCEVRLDLQPTVGRWDRMRIEQVVTNLLSNAIKYGRAKPIAITVAAQDDVASLVVEDEGIGFDPEEAGRIFERFERAVPATQYGGLGLGLYIVRQIVEAHGGRVEVTTRPGSGSRFVVALPQHDVESASAVPEGLVEGRTEPSP